MSCLTAAVAGVMLNLVVCFGLLLFFEQLGDRSVGPLRLLIPELGSLNGLSLVVTVLAWLVLWRSRLSAIPVRLVAASLGALLSLLMGVGSG